VDRGLPSGGHGPCSVRRVGPSPPDIPEQKAPWALRIAVPVAGEREKPSWKPTGLRKRGGRQRASREQARAGKWRVHSALPAVLQVPGGLGKGAQAPGCAGLSSRCIHELATEGVRAERIGVTPSQQCGSHGSWRWLVSGFLVGESLLGPDLLKLGWRGAREGGHATGCAVRQGPPPHRAHRVNRVRGDLLLCSWIELVAEIGGGARRCIAQAGSAGNAGDGRRPGSRKRAAFDEAAGGGGPGSFSLGGASNPINPGEGARQRASEARVTAFVQEEHAWKKERRAEGSRSRAHRSERAWGPQETGDNRAPALKPWARRQAKPRSIMLSAKVSAGRAAWKPPSPAKADGGGDSRARRSVECSYWKSVADVG
jgi:hypothetical protein